MNLIQLRWVYLCITGHAHPSEDPPSPEPAGCRCQWRYVRSPKQRRVRTDGRAESDPYVKVAVAPGITFISPEANKVEWKKTGVVSKNRNPVWTKDAEFSLDVKDPVHEKLWFQVFDKDLVGSDDPLGATCTSFHSLVQGQVESRCLKLSGSVSKNEGQLFVELEALDFQGERANGYA